MSEPHDPAGGKPPPRPTAPRPGPPRPTPSTHRTLLGGAANPSSDGTPAGGTQPKLPGTIAFEAVPPAPATDTRRTVAFEAVPETQRHTAAFKALPADAAEARKRKKGLSTTIAFGDEQIAANLREVERLRQQEAAQEAAEAAASTGDRRTPTQFAPAATRPSAPAPASEKGLDRTVAFEAAGTEPSTRKKRSFGGTIAFGAASDEGSKSRTQTVAFEAFPDGGRPGSQPPSAKADMGSTMAFEAPRPEPAEPARGFDATVTGAAGPTQPSVAVPAARRTGRHGELGSTMAFDPNEGQRPGREDAGLGSTMAFESPLADKGTIELDGASKVAVSDVKPAKRTMIGGLGAIPAGIAPSPEAGPAQAGPTQAGPAQAGPAQAGPAHGGPMGASPTQLGLGGAEPVAAAPLGAPPHQTGTPPMGPPQGGEPHAAAGLPPTPHGEPYRSAAPSAPPGAAPPPTGAAGPDASGAYVPFAPGMDAPGMNPPGMNPPGMNAPGMNAPGVNPMGPGMDPSAAPAQPAPLAPAPSRKKPILLGVGAVAVLAAVAIILWLSGVV